MNNNWMLCRCRILL